MTIKNRQLKHINLCMNQVDDDYEKQISELLERTGDDFGLTLSSNKLSEEVVKRLHDQITAQHKVNVDIAASKSDDEATHEGSQLDKHIHIKRLAV